MTAEILFHLHSFNYQNYGDAGEWCSMVTLLPDFRFCKIFLVVVILFAFVGTSLPFYIWTCSWESSFKRLESFIPRNCCIITFECVCVCVSIE